MRGHAVFVAEALDEVGGGAKPKFLGDHSNLVVGLLEPSLGFPHLLPADLTAYGMPEDGRNGDRPQRHILVCKRDLHRRRHGRACGQVRQLGRPHPVRNRRGALRGCGLPQPMARSAKQLRRQRMTTHVASGLVVRESTTT